MKKIDIAIVVYIGVCILGALLATAQIQHWNAQREVPQPPTLIQEFNPSPIIFVEEDEQEEEVKETVADDILFAQIVMAESGNQAFVGKVAVATTILNRVECRNMSLRAVLEEENQFTTPDPNPTEDCFRAIQFAMENRDLFPKNMVYFRAWYYHENLGTPYIQIGDHYFSVEKQFEK